MMGPTEPLASGVIAYNGDSDRGWNDPPTLSFATVAGSRKGPKLDLRKRVSHQEALTGRRVTSPLTQNPPNIYEQGSNLSNGLSNLTMSSQSQQLPPVISPSTSPCHSRHSSGTYTPPLLPDAKCYGMVPPQYPKHSYSPGQNGSPSQPPYGNMVQGPLATDSVNPTTAPPKIFSPVETILRSDTGIVHPLAQKSSTTSPMQPLPVTTPSNLGKPLFSFPHSFHMVPIASALDTSHVRSNPEISPGTSPQTVDNGNTSQVPCFQKNNMVTQGPLIFTPSLTTADSMTALPMSNAEKRSPVLNKAYQNGNRTRIYTPPPAVNDSGKNSPTVTRSPVSTPTGGRSASSSPRSSTPDNGYRSEDTSRHNSVEFDSQESLKVTVEAVEETIIKCSDILKAREIEDVKKKVGTMKQQWSDGKLSIPVQMTMKLLTKALLDGDNETAQKLHLKLMVDYVGEVKQWMVAIKRLISAMANVNSPVS